MRPKSNWRRYIGTNVPPACLTIALAMGLVVADLRGEWQLTERGKAYES